MQNLISVETERCNNHRCSLRTTCERYMQLAIDKHVDNGSVTVERFEPEMEDHKIAVFHCEFYSQMPERRMHRLRQELTEIFIKGKL